MPAKPYRTIKATGVGTDKLQFLKQPASKRRVELLVREAIKIETLLSKLLYSHKNVVENWDSYTRDDTKLRHLDSFGKQVATQMLRSNPEFQGFKLEFGEPALKPDVLFLLGTLCKDFDYMHTSPLYGLNILDLACGSLSPYVKAEDTSNLVKQFYNDRPPIAAELLQILGAHTVGIDSRPNCKDVYSYPLSYKHKVMEFVNIKNWMQTLDYCFDVISCLNVFSKTGFGYYYSSAKEIAQFLASLKNVLSPQGFLYCTPPLIPCSASHRDTNRQIFNDAGFRICYEGYYLLLQPMV
jgi:hypothetical protein